MKILFLTEYYPPKIFGGGEIGARILAENLAADHNVIILTSRFSESEKSDNQRGVKIIRRLETGVPGGFLNEVERSLAFKRSMRRELPKIIEEENPDVIHCLNTSSIDASSDIEVGVPMVGTINSYRNFCPKANLFFNEEEECMGGGFSKCVSCMFRSEHFGKTKVSPFLKIPMILPFYEFYRRRKKSLGKMSHLIAISSFVEKVLLETDVSADMISVIPNPMEINAESKEGIKLSSEFINVVSLSALEKIKGIDILVKGLAEIESEKIRMNIAGTGSEDDNLKRLVRELGVEDMVDFLGKVPYEKIPGLYSQSDIVTIPSKWPEPLSRIGTESLFFGKPLLATNVGGNRDLVEDGVNGFLIKPNEMDFAKKIEKLVESKGLRDEMGKESKKIFERKFEKSKIIKRITKVYQELTN